MAPDLRTTSLATEIVSTARRLGLRIATAESLTGGLLADAIVTVPGASRVYTGGVVAYDTELKRALLGVAADRLNKTGPVDGEVARQMARGVREVCAVPRTSANAPIPADVGVATTGVAGPDPDSQTGQPPGTVWVCVSSADGDMFEAHSLQGERDEIRQGAVDRALILLLRYLSQVDSSSGKIQE